MFQARVKALLTSATASAGVVTTYTAPFHVRRHSLCFLSVPKEFSLPPLRSAFFTSINTLIPATPIKRSGTLCPTLEIS